MKRPADESWGKGGKTKRVPGTPGSNAFKVLISEYTATAMIGKGGGPIKEIQATTGAKIHLSSRGEYYPNTAAQEANVQAPGAEALNTALQHILNKALEADGIQEGQETQLSIVVPKPVASTVIGKGGSNIKELRASTGCKVHIDEATFGTEDAREQSISLTGLPDGIYNAMMQISNWVQEMVNEPFFATWASTSLAGSGDAGAVMGGKGKGKGKDKGFEKGGFDKGYDKGWGGKDAWGKEGGGKGWDQGWDKGAAPPWEKGGSSWGKSAGGGKKGPPSNGHVIAYAGGDGGSDALMAAAHRLSPDQVHAPAPVIAIGIPSGMVSGLIGKGGQGVKDITQSTGAKVAVREIEGDPSQKSVHISGTPLNAAAAYILVAGRMAELSAQGGQLF